MTRIIDEFKAAMKFMVTKEKYGTQVKLADAVNVDPKYINQILRTDKRSPSLDLQERIATELGYRYEDFLAIGRMILEGEPEKEIKNTASVLRKREGTHKVTSETKIGWTNQKPDLTLIQQVIEAVEEHLQNNQLTMPPAKIAELVAVLYEEVSESSDKQLSKGTVARMIKLAS